MDVDNRVEIPSEGDAVEEINDNTTSQVCDLKQQKTFNSIQDFLANETNGGNVVAHKEHKVVDHPKMNTIINSETSGSLINAESEDGNVSQLGDPVSVPPSEQNISQQNNKISNTKDVSEATSNNIPENKVYNYREEEPKEDTDALNDTDEGKAPQNICTRSTPADVVKEDEDVSNGNQNEGEESATKQPPVEWLDILGSGHLMKKIIKAGTPDSRPEKSDICILNLIGRLEDGTVVEQADNLKIHLSDNEVIQGVDFALALMEKGEEADIKVTSRFGYGTLGRQPNIPPGATILYRVTLVDVLEDPPIHMLNVEERIQSGLKKKERGNWWYARGEHTLAIHCYRRALDYLDDTDIPEPHTPDDVQRLLDERLKTYNNLGASQMKISAFDAALMSVNNVLNCQPRNVKALFRKAKILKEKGELQESIDVVRQGLSYDPESQSLQQELSSLLASQRKANSKQRELYKKMLGNSNQSSEDKKKDNISKNSTLKWMAGMGFAVAIIGMIAKYKFNAI